MTELVVEQHPAAVSTALSLHLVCVPSPGASTRLAAAKWAFQSITCYSVAQKQRCVHM
jgi:hypothetical protein